MRTGLRTIAAGLVIGAAVSYASAVSAEDGWITLLDASNKGEWTEVGKANWAMKDGAYAADKLDGKDLSYLVSKNAYKDFQIRAEFWTDEEANSGIFIRCEQRDKIDAKVCYEVNIFDKRPDPTYGTGAIVDVAKVDPMPKAAGKWNVYEITAQGAASHHRAERAEDRRRGQLQARQRRTVRPAIRLGRGEVPQGADQAALICGDRYSRLTPPCADEPSGARPRRCG